MPFVSTSEFEIPAAVTHHQNLRTASRPAWNNWLACILVLFVTLLQSVPAQAQAVWSNMQAFGGGALTPPATSISGGISGAVKVGHGGDTITAVYLYEAGNSNVLATQLYSTAGMSEFPNDDLRGFRLTAQLPVGVHQLYVTSYAMNGESADSAIFTVTVTGPTKNSNAQR